MATNETSMRQPEADLVDDLIAVAERELAAFPGAMPALSGPEQA